MRTRRTAGRHMLAACTGLNACGRACVARARMRTDFTHAYYLPRSRPKGVFECALNAHAQSRRLQTRACTVVSCSRIVLELLSRIQWMHARPRITRSI
eukprot:6194631-Pleurochrysis_carterae.AAC.1